MFSFFKKQPAPVESSPLDADMLEITYLNKDKQPTVIHMTMPKSYYIYNRTGHSLLIDRVIDIIKKSEGISYVVLKSIKII